LVLIWELIRLGVSLLAGLDCAFDGRPLGMAILRPYLEDQVAVVGQAAGGGAEPLPAGFAQWKAEVAVGVAGFVVRSNPERDMAAAAATIAEENAEGRETESQELAELFHLILSERGLILGTASGWDDLLIIAYFHYKCNYLATGSHPTGPNGPKQKPHHKDEAFVLAGSTGLEPAISSVTGRRANHYTTSPGVDNRHIVTG
jgi:hypothetical protein